MKNIQVKGNNDKNVNAGSYDVSKCHVGILLKLTHLFVTVGNLT